MSSCVWCALRGGVCSVEAQTSQPDAVWGCDGGGVTVITPLTDVTAMKLQRGRSAKIRLP